VVSGRKKPLLIFTFVLRNAIDSVGSDFDDIFIRSRGFSVVCWVPLNVGFLSDTVLASVCRAVTVHCGVAGVLG
jgi:hypothetical protein